MDFEERERQKRRQMISVIIAEVGMFLSVIAIVVVATMAAMGFFVTPEGTIEQTGLVQIHSQPTGATVELDGNTIFSKTNLTRSLTAGEHSLKLSRGENYDTWEKTIKMYSGMLIRLYYPRIFLKDRTPEMVTRLGQELEFFAPSEDYSYIIYMLKNDPKWYLLNIRGDEVKTSTVDLAAVLPEVKKGEFAGEISYVEWSENSDRVLIRAKVGDRAQWILVDLRDTKKSLNLTQTFGLDFTKVEMIDDSATQLFALENQHLRKIDISGQAISRVLLTGVEDFSAEGVNIIYTMVNGTGENRQRAVGVYKDGEKGGTTIMNVGESDRVRVALAKFYDEDYMAMIVNDKVTVYYGTLPSYRENTAEIDFLNFKVLVDAAQIALLPEEISISEEGQYLAMRSGDKNAVVDFEMGDLYEYEAEVDRIGWLNEGMMYTTVGDRLEVWDFDYTNRRILVKAADFNLADVNEKSVTTQSKYPVARQAATISYNEKWLYYVVRNTDTNELILQRERVKD